MLHTLSRINTFPARTFAESRPRFQYATCCYETQYNCRCCRTRYFAVYEKRRNSFTSLRTVTRLRNGRQRNQRSVSRRSMKVESFRKLPDGLWCPQTAPFKMLSKRPPRKKKRPWDGRIQMTAHNHLLPGLRLSISVPPPAHLPSRPEPYYLT